MSFVAAKGFACGNHYFVEGADVSEAEVDDPELFLRLKDLGYINEAPPPADPAAPPATPPAT